MKKILTTALFLSASVQAEQTIDQLISSANSIQSSIDNAKAGIYGITYYASVGGIASDSALSSGYISQEQMDAYNSALDGVSNATYYNAQEFFNDQYETSMAQLTQAVDTFSNAAVQIETALAVTEVAVEADTVPEQQGLQTYIAQNDVEITQAEVSAYNQSLDQITEIAQNAAAFKAASQDAQVMQIADDAASAYNTSLYGATAQYTASQGALEVAFMNGGGFGMIGFLDYANKADLDIMGVGQSIYQDQGWYE